MTKKGVFTKQGRAELTDLVIYVILPCSIFASFHKGISAETLRQCFIVLIASFGMQLLYMILNRFLYAKFPPQRRSAAQYAMIANNAGFMGLPLISAVFGDTGVLYAGIALVPLRIFMWTAGLSLFTETERKKKIKILATHPCILAVVLGFGYIFAPFTLPVFLSDAISLVGDCTTAVTMLIIGSILSEVKPKSILDKQCLYYSFFRLIALPALLFAALTVLGADPLTRGVLVISAGMPAAATTAMLAEKYEKDFAFASVMVFTSTILSMITLPITAEILARW